MEKESKNNSQKINFKDFDKLNLKSFAENLLQDIEKGVASSIGDQGVYTISLNAEFGNGKTTFLEMFKNFITEKKDDEYNIISINAWESDFYREPIISILSELINLIKKQAKQDKNTVNKILKILGKIANQVVEKKTGLDLKELIDFCNKKNSQKDSNQEAEIIKGQNILKDLNQRKEAIKEIKKVISEYTKDKKLLIIVDELDRARPDYAIHFLEDIKHFFDIENVIFLVAVNRKQMENTVKCLYGQNLNFDGYYRKFFKREMDLPDPYKEASRLVDALIKKTQIKYSLLKQDKSYRIRDSCLSCKIFNLTLREIEMFIRIFEFMLGSKNQVAKWVEMNCYSFFIYLFLKERDTFNKILSGNYRVDFFIQFVSKKGFDYKSDHDLTNIKQTEKHDLNYLLGQVAASFTDSEASLNVNKSKIEVEFTAVQNVEKFVQYEDFDLGRITGLSFKKGQPALEFCKNINEYKRVFES